MSENKSEVARLLQQFDDEYQAAYNGLSGLAYGTARHDFISKKIEGMEKAREQLEGLVGEEEAMKLIKEKWENA
jgi:hypothetical protein